MEKNISNNLKKIIEALLMVSQEPLSVDKMKQVLDEELKPNRNQIKNVLAELQQDYTERGVELKELASGYCFQANQGTAPFIAKLWEQKPPRYSRALLETLAIIAYRQPMTRAEIEDIRGVAVSSNIIKVLLERSWVKVVGHRDVPGKPGIYATTRNFLDYFNLKSLDELPTLQEVKDIDKLFSNLELSLEETVELSLKTQISTQNEDVSQLLIEQSSIELATTVDEDDLSLIDNEGTDV